MRWDTGVGGLWKVGVDNLTMHTHFRTCTFTCFCYCLNYVLNPVLLTFSICKYSFETCFVNISLVDYDLPATAFKGLMVVFPNVKKNICFEAGIRF